MKDATYKKTDLLFKAIIAGSLGFIALLYALSTVKIFSMLG